MQHHQTNHHSDKKIYLLRHMKHRTHQKRGQCRLTVNDRLWRNKRFLYVWHMVGHKLMILVSVKSNCNSSAAFKSILLLHFWENCFALRRKMQRLARRRAIATVGSGWQQLWHRVWMEDGWWGGGGQGEEAGGAASPGGHLWRPLHTWWDLLVSIKFNNKEKPSGLFFIITVTLRHHEQVFKHTTSIVTHHWKSYFCCYLNHNLF